MKVWNNKGTILVGIFIVILIVFGIIFSVSFTFNDTHYIATVTDKTRITETSDGYAKGYYLIFCENKDTGEYYEFKCSDEALRGKFDSSSFYNRIKVGKTYDFTVIGYRFPLVSAYQNIIAFEELE